MAAKAYSRAGEWAESRIRATRKGWLVEHNSRITGETTDWRVFIPYGGDFARGCNLDAPWSDYGDRAGDALLYRANSCRLDPAAKQYYHARILSRGFEVR